MEWGERERGEFPLVRTLRYDPTLSVNVPCARWRLVLSRAKKSFDSAPTNSMIASRESETLLLPCYVKICKFASSTSGMNFSTLTNYY